MAEIIVRPKVLSTDGVTYDNLYFLPYIQVGSFHVSPKSSTGFYEITIEDGRNYFRDGDVVSLRWTSSFSRPVETTFMYTSQTEGQPLYTIPVSCPIYSAEFTKINILIPEIFPITSDTKKIRVALKDVMGTLGSDNKIEWTVYDPTQTITFSLNKIKIYR